MVGHTGTVTWRVSCSAHVRLVRCVRTALLEITLLKSEDDIVVSTKNVGKDESPKQIQVKKTNNGIDTILSARNPVTGSTCLFYQGTVTLW